MSDEQDHLSTSAGLVGREQSFYARYAEWCGVPVEQLRVELSKEDNVDLSTMSRERALNAGQHYLEEAYQCSPGKPELFDRCCRLAELYLRLAALL